MKTVKHILETKGREVWVVHPDDSVLTALKLMAAKEVGALVVMAQGRVVGMLSERDYARKVILLGKSSQDTPTRDIMTTQVVVTHLEQTVEECMALVTEKRIRHLPVLQGEQLVGLVSIGDLVKTMLEEQQFKIEQLENYITG